MYRVFTQHHRYDECYTITHLVMWLLNELFGEEKWWAILHEYARGTVQETVPPSLSAIIVRYAPICIVMTNFFEQLKLAPAATPYLVDELERLCEGIQ